MIAFIQNSFSCLAKADPEYKSLTKKAIVTAASAAVAICTPWETTRIVGSTILTGMGYGMANELIASWGRSQHISDSFHLRNRPIQGLHPNLNAIINAMVDYWSVSAIAGMVFACIARAPLPILGLKVRAAQITPSLVKGAFLITLLVQVIFQVAQKYYPINKQKTCGIQQAASYGFVKLGGIFLGTAILAARVGLVKL